MLHKIKSFLFHNTALRQTVAKNAFWLSVSNFGGRLLRAIIIVYSARILGAGAWGVFNYAITLVAFLTIFTDFGINLILTRESSKAKDAAERAAILSTSFLLKIALLALGMGIVISAAYLPIPAFSAAAAIFPIVALVMAFDTIRDFCFAISRSLEKMEWEAGIFIFTNISIVVAGFIFLYLSPTVASFAWSYAVGTGAGMAAALFVMRAHFKNLFSNFRASAAKYILISAWPFAFANALSILMINTDVLIIGIMRSNADVGYYSAANRIIQILYALPAIVAITILPALSRLAVSDQAKLRAMLEKTITTLLLVAIPTALGGIILGDKIIALLFGAEYLPAVAAFRILLITLIFSSASIILGDGLFVYNHQKKLIVYSALGGISNVIFDLALIPRFGIAGSAWATVISQIISISYLWITMKKVNYFSVLPRLKKIFIASCAMSAAVWLLAALGLHVVAVVILAALFYPFALYCLKEPAFLEITDAFLRKVRISDTSSPPTPPPAV